jgi:hypothetical protein
VVPNSVKDQLWNDVLKHFTLPEGVDANLVKGWTIVKMATQFQNFKKKLTRDFIKNNQTPNWDEYPKIKDHWTYFVEYKKSEIFAQKSAQGKNSANKKEEYNHSLGRGGYAVAIPKWRKMEQDLITKGIISAVFHWPDRLKNWYYAHGGRLNPDDGTLEFPLKLQEKALELMKKIEDVKAGRLKVDREMDELTMALGNPGHPGRCRGYGVVSWKYAFKGNLDSYKSRKRRKEREEEHWCQMMEQRLKEQEEKMQVEIEWRLDVTISQIAQTGTLPEVPLDPVISPSARKSSCASTEVAPGACIEVAPGACTEGPEEPRAIEGVPVDDNQQYMVDFLCRCTPSELHKPFGNHIMQVAYGSAFLHFLGQTSHEILIPKDRNGEPERGE